MKDAIKIKVNDNYLKYRRIYIGEYLLYKNNKNFQLGYFFNKQSTHDESALILLMKEYVEKELPSSIEFFNSIELLNGENKLNEIDLFSNKRLSYLIVNYLMNVYKIEMEKGTFPPSILMSNNYSPIDITSLNGKDMPCHYILALFDFISIVINYKKTILDLDDIKRIYFSYYQSYENAFDFLPKNSIALNWMKNRMMNKKIWSLSDANVLIRNEELKCILSCFDTSVYVCASSSRLSEVKLFLLQTRKAWSQKKFRDRVKGKEVLNTYISKEAKLKLKKIAKHHNKNINEIIEAMIEQINLPKEPLEELTLSIKKEN